MSTPRTYAEVLLKRWKHSAPSRSHLQRHELSIDIALLLHMQNLEAGQYVRFGLADSSPVAGHDWLWSQRIQIRPG